MLHVTIEQVKEAVAEVLAAHSTPWLNTAGAAAYLGIEPDTMKAWRQRGYGPRYRLVNRRLVRYHRDDLDAFILGGDADG